MKLPAFDYASPTSLTEPIGLLAAGAGSAARSWSACSKTRTVDS